MRCPSLRKLSAMTSQEAQDMLKILAGTPLRWSAAGAPRDVQHLGTVEENRANLEPQTVSNSKCQMKIPVKSDLATREKYISFQGTLRIGKLLEDLDLGAVIAGYKHNKRKQPDDSFSISLVTAAVDKMLIYRPFSTPDDGDLLINSHVSWVGKSSMEITERVIQNENPILDAKFVMVARHALEDRAVPVNPLITETDLQKQEFQAGEFSKNDRKERCRLSLLHAPPNLDESVLIHSLFKETIDASQKTFKRLSKDSKDCWMSDAVLKSCIICHPQHRNIYGKIFGGFVMRKAYEISWSTAYIFGKKKLQPVFMDDVAFRKPVSIGDLLFLSSQVTFTQDNLVLVRCHAEVKNPRAGQQETTNEFYFVFSIVEDEGAAAEVPRVIPKTYAEYMLYLDGRRHYDSYKNIVTAKIINSKL